MIERNEYLSPDSPPMSWANQNDAMTNYSIILPFENWPDRRAYAYWQHDNWTIAVWGVSFYIVFIVCLGQKLMSYREKGFQLRVPLLIWNISSALFSMYGFYRTSQELFRVWSRHGWQHTICVSSYIQDGVFCWWIRAFICSKFLEFFDTTFLILRKKPVSFLHWYHHASSLVFCWHGASTLAAAGRWFCWMNFGVHSAMYTYFAWRTYGYGTPKFVAMSVTSIQILQIVVGCKIAYDVYTIKTSGGACHQPWSNIYMAFVIYVAFFFIFTNFYYNRYFRNGGKGGRAATAASKKALGQRNGEKDSTKKMFERDNNIRHRNVGEAVN